MVREVVSAEDQTKKKSSPTGLVSVMFGSPNKTEIG